MEENKNTDSEENQVLINTTINRHNQTENKKINSDLKQRIKNKPNTAQESMGILGTQIFNRYTHHEMTVQPQSLKVFT